MANGNGNAGIAGEKRKPAVIVPVPPIVAVVDADVVDPKVIDPVLALHEVRV
jgi:hypothetical protein